MKSFTSIVFLLTLIVASVVAKTWKELPSDKVKRRSDRVKDIRRLQNRLAMTVPTRHERELKDSSGDDDDESGDDDGKGGDDDDEESGDDDGKGGDDDDSGDSGGDDDDSGDDDGKGGDDDDDSGDNSGDDDDESGDDDGKGGDDDDDEGPAPYPAPTDPPVSDYGLPPPTDYPTVYVPPPTPKATAAPVYVPPPTDAPVYVPPPTDAPVYVPPPTNAPVYVAPKVTAAPVYVPPPTPYPAPVAPPVDAVEGDDDDSGKGGDDDDDGSSMDAGDDDDESGKGGDDDDDGSSIDSIAAGGDDDDSGKGGDDDDDGSSMDAGDDDDDSGKGGDDDDDSSPAPVYVTPATPGPTIYVAPTDYPTACTKSGTEEVMVYNVKLGPENQVSPYVGVAYAQGMAMVELYSLEVCGEDSKYWVCLTSNVKGFSPAGLTINNEEIFKNGPVVVDFTVDAKLSDPQSADFYGCSDLTETTFTNMMNNPDMYYLSANLGTDQPTVLTGIRGQLVQSFTATVDAAQAVAPYDAYPTEGAGGTATISIEQAGGVVCFDACLSSFDPTVAQVHFGMMGTDGEMNIVFDFSSTKVGEGRFFGCKTAEELGVTMDVICELIADPGLYYVDFHMSSILPGILTTVRGQLPGTD